MPSIIMSSLNFSRIFLAGKSIKFLSVKNILKFFSNNFKMQRWGKIIQKDMCMHIQTHSKNLPKEMDFFLKLCKCKYGCPVVFEKRETVSS